MNKYHTACCLWLVSAGFALLDPNGPNVAATLASLGAAYANGILAKAWLIIREPEQG